MKYETIDPMSENEAEAVIARNDAAELLYIPVAVGLHAERLDWAQDVCIRLASHPHYNVRGNAILGFGHLARRFGMLDRVRVEPLIRYALRDPDDYVRGHAVATADDVNHFLGWAIPTAV